MAIAKIKAMKDMLRQMEEMQKNVNEDINKDINKKRKEALKQIRKYFDEVAESLDGMSISIPLKDGEIFGTSDHFQYVRFNLRYPTTSEGYNTSENPIKWFIKGDNGYKKDDSNYYKYIDSTNNIESVRRPGEWGEGFINLIENWKDIKPVIENGIEESLNERMEEIRKRTTERVAQYEKVNNFEV